MLKLLTLIKNYKQIVSLIGVLVALGSLYSVYNNMKTGWYEEGVRDTEIAYKQKMVELQEEYTVRLEKELANYRQAMNRKHAAEIERIKAERLVEVEVKEVIEYVEREIKIPTECDTVPNDFSRLFNKAIRDVNGEASF